MDYKKIIWKVIGTKIIGKRGVTTNDGKKCWLEDTTPEEVKSFWYGENADYFEEFNRTKNNNN